MAFGRQAEGADLEWFPGALGEEPLDSLPQVTEEDVTAFLAACAPIIGAELPESKQRTRSHARQCNRELVANRGGAARRSPTAGRQTGT